MTGLSKTFAGAPVGNLFRPARSNAIRRTCPVSSKAADVDLAPPTKRVAPRAPEGK